MELDLPAAWSTPSASPGHRPRRPSTSSWRNESSYARDFFLNASPQTEWPPLGKRPTSAISSVPQVGGPIAKGRTFIFGDYEGITPEAGRRCAARFRLTMLERASLQAEVPRRARAGQLRTTRPAANVCVDNLQSRNTWRSILTPTGRSTAIKGSSPMPGYEVYGKISLPPG